jgi:uncharacterized protein YqgC (DUF456 family)
MRMMIAIVGAMTPAVNPSTAIILIAAARKSIMNPAYAAFSGKSLRPLMLISDFNGICG